LTIGSWPSAIGLGRQLPGELSFIAAILDVPVIQGIGTWLYTYLREHHSPNVYFGVVH
jgi:hypothetical protein